MLLFNDPWVVIKGRVLFQLWCIFIAKNWGPSCVSKEVAVYTETRPEAGNDGDSGSVSSWLISITALGGCEPQRLWENWVGSSNTNKPTMLCLTATDIWTPQPAHYHDVHTCLLETLHSCHHSITHISHQRFAQFDFSHFYFAWHDATVHVSWSFQSSNVL